MSFSGNQYSVGSDAKLTIMANGVPVRATLLVDFQAKQETADLESIGIDGVTRYRSLEKGWSIDLTFDRGDSIIDDFFAAKEAARYAGQAPPHVTITQTINNPNGTISRYRFEGVALKFDDAGTWAGDKTVQQKVSGKASRRVAA